MHLVIRLISFVNLTLAALLILSWALFAYFRYYSPSENVTPLFVNEKPALPPYPFRYTDKQFDLSKGIWALPPLELEYQLPDLKSELMFLGKNERPDSLDEQGRAEFCFSCKSSGDKKLYRKGSPIYLCYQKEGSAGGRYGFSLVETPLWVEIQGENNHQIQLTQFLKDEVGKIMVEPAERHKFALAKEESASRTVFEIGNLRADGMLLFRQKAKAVGRDLFLEQHGGEPYKDCAVRERIDFLEGEQPTYCFIKPGDFLIWKEGQWIRVDRAQSPGHPLLYVKQCDERSIQFELWDVEGRQHLPLTLIRTPTTEPWPNMETEFKFIGAKTWSQFLVECRGKRLVLRVNDWLVLTEKGWEKISDEQKVDDYVERRLIAPLFILDKWEKREGKQVLLGHLFNRDRNEMQQVELPVGVGGSAAETAGQDFFDEGSILED